jgi:hypothetical protein
VYGVGKQPAESGERSGAESSSRQLQEIRIRGDITLHAAAQRRPVPSRSGTERRTHHLRHLPQQVDTNHRRPRPEDLSVTHRTIQMR